MGRRSKLTPDQWEDAAKRIGKGEPYREVAALFGVKENTLRKGLMNLRDLAVDKSLADLSVRNISNEISKLGESQQRIVNTLAATLTSISGHLAKGADWSAMSFSRLAWMANIQAQKSDDADPFSEDSAKALQRFLGLQEMANVAATVPLNLLRANKEAVDALNRPEPPDAAALLAEIAEALPD